jgi:endogenous inhibitor of DNA gyrase (YacG/DUF329 family)
VLPDSSQRVSFTCPECQTEGITHLGAIETSEKLEVTCDYCQRVVVVALNGAGA